jgi:hypothetical protein
LNTAKTERKHGTFYWGWLTLIIGAVLAALSIFWVEPPTTEQQATALPWEAKINHEGNLEVLGLTLGKSSTRDAMALYGKEVQVNLFANMQGEAISLESFFEDMYIGYSLRGRLVLTLDVKPEQLSRMLEAGARIKTTETGVREVSLSSDDSGLSLDIPIRALTYLPYPKIDESTLKSRFGEPDQDSVGDDGIRRWHYPALKLVILFHDSDRKSLQFGE